MIHVYHTCIILSYTYVTAILNFDILGLNPSNVTFKMTNFLTGLFFISKLLFRHRSPLPYLLKRKMII